MQDSAGIEPYPPRRNFLTTSAGAVVAGATLERAIAAWPTSSKTGSRAASTSSPSSTRPSSRLHATGSPSTRSPCRCSRPRFERILIRLPAGQAFHSAGRRFRVARAAPH